MGADLRMYAGEETRLALGGGRCGLLEGRELGPQSLHLLLRLRLRLRSRQSGSRNETARRTGR